MADSRLQKHALFYQEIQVDPIFLPPLQNNSQYLFLNAHGSKKHQFLSTHSTWHTLSQRHLFDNTAP